jgi:hypothetical protein
MKTATKVQQEKIVHILGRAEFKTSGYVLYRAQAEVSGVRHETHDVTVVNGKVTNCSECKSWQYNRKCCHATEVQKRENERLVDAGDTMIEQVTEKQNELGSCDTCGRMVKPGVTICAKCLGF